MGEWPELLQIRYFEADGSQRAGNERRPQSREICSWPNGHERMLEMQREAGYACLSYADSGDLLRNI